MIDKLLNVLTKVKRTGRESWVACCPAHADKNPSLTITQKDDTVLLHCFAGCSVEEVLGAIGLTFDDLYPEKPFDGHARKPEKMPFNPRDVLAAVSFESAIVAIAACHIAQGKALNPDDFDRLAVATTRLHAAAELCHADN